MTSFAKKLRFFVTLLQNLVERLSNIYCKKYNIIEMWKSKYFICDPVSVRKN